MGTFLIFLGIVVVIYIEHETAFFSELWNETFPYLPPPTPPLTTEQIEYRNKLAAEKTASEAKQFLEVQKQFHEVQKHVRIREDRLVDLGLFKLVERCLGRVSWSKMKYLPRYVSWINTPPEVLPLKIALSQQFQQESVSAAYSSDIAGDDARMIYSLTLPLFIPDSKDARKTLTAQNAELLFVARVLRVAQVALKQPDILGPSNLSSADVCAAFRGVLRMQRENADKFLKDAENTLATRERARHLNETQLYLDQHAMDAERLARDVQRESERRAMSSAVSSARFAIMDGLPELFVKHGEFLSYDQLVAHVNMWTIENVIGGANPEACLDELERKAIVFHSSRLLDELGNGTSDTVWAILRKRVSESRPLEELRRVFEEIQRLVELQPEPAMSAEGAIEEEHKLKSWLEQFNRNCDETITDELQKGLAKEKFYNSQYRPAMQELAKRRAGL